MIKRNDNQIFCSNTLDSVVDDFGN